MPIFLTIALAVALMVVLLRRKTAIGPSILAAGLLIWLFESREATSLIEALRITVTSPRSWDLLGALYFVVCLEIELRKSGTLKGMVRYVLGILPSKKIAMAAMPAFLGLLPSIGGARFSAPIVAEIARGEAIDNNRLAGINFWFRHIFEFASPIIPGMILACAITKISVADLILHLLWASVLSFALGWAFLMTGFKTSKRHEVNEEKGSALDFWVAILPIVAVFALMIFAKTSAAVSMGIVAVVMVPVLALLGRKVGLKDIFWGACEKSLFRDVGCILLFIGILHSTGVLEAIVLAFESAPIPTPAVIAGIAFAVGMLTGMSQGHVAIVMPMVAAVSSGDLNLAGVALVFGVGGQMLTPTHVCLMVTIDYFKSDFFKTLLPCVLAEILLLTTFSVVTYLTWP